MSKIEVNTVEPQCGTTLTLGGSGDTVALGSGAAQTGFGREGSVDWQTGSIKTGTFTAATGEGYFVNTAAAISTVNLPAGVAGSIVAIADYTRTFNTYNCTVAPNGAEKIGGEASATILDVNGQSATFVYVDGTEGWINVQETETSVIGVSFITATGGTPCAGETSGDYRYHTFTGPGTFCVSSVGIGQPQSDQVSYIVAAGGGGGAGAGGGAGGFREGKNSNDPYTASPLDSTSSLTVTASPYSIVVGAGGAGGNGWNPGARVTDGADSSFSTITSTGGGEAGWNSPITAAAGDGGSGGGAGNGPGAGGTVGSGNTPSFSPPQGNDGGTSSPGPGANVAFGGGGGASAVGTGGTQNPPPGAGNAGNGGAGVSSSITASPIGYAGGGGGGAQVCGPVGPSPTGGGTASQGGGNGVSGTLNGISGGCNTGGGGGGNGAPCSYTSGGGGSGVVIIRYKFQ